MLTSMQNSERSYCPARRASIAGILLIQFGLTMAGRVTAQEIPSTPSVQDSTMQVNPPATSSNSSSPVITFSDALRRATTNHPPVQAALTAAGLAHQDLVQSRAAMLPNVNYDMGYIYTQSLARGANAPIFIANNGVHEYIAQGNVHQQLSLQAFADYGRASAAQAVARARAEIALRGLAVTVKAI